MVGQKIWWKKKFFYLFLEHIIPPFIGPKKGLLPS